MIIGQRFLVKINASMRELHRDLLDPGGGGTQNVRDHAEEHGLRSIEAIEAGLVEKERVVVTRQRER